MTPSELPLFRRRFFWRGRCSPASTSENDDEQRLLSPKASQIAQSSVGYSSGYSSSPYRVAKTHDNGTKADITRPPSSSHARKAMKQTPLSSIWCGGCEQARSCPGYEDRVASLIDRLYCAGCQADQPAILFSHSSRQAERSNRLCIGLEGHFTLCPHLKLKLSDIEAWKVAGQDVELSCQRSTCPSAGVTVTCRPGRLLDPYWNNIWVNWRAPVKDTLPGTTFWDRSVSMAEQLYESCPPLFCPAFQVTPGRLFHLRNFKDDLLFKKEKLKCLSTNGSFLYYDPQNEIIKSSRSVSQQKDRDTLLPRNWINNIDPDSYGHFADPETKHITWCSDRSCATTRELVKFYALISIACGYRDGGISHNRYEIGISILDKRVEDILRSHERSSRLI